jgi:hypothetical protein
MGNQQPSRLETVGRFNDYRCGFLCFEKPPFVSTPRLNSLVEVKASLTIPLVDEGDKAARARSTHENLQRG